MLASADLLQYRIATKITDENPDIEGVQWTDNIARVDPDENRFYLITGVNTADIESPHSDIIGEFSFDLHITPDTDYTWITLPLQVEGISVAEELADAIGDDCISVGEFDANTQSYITHIHGTPLFDFSVSAGNPYRVQMSQASEIRFIGKVAPESSYSLLTTPDTDYTWIMLPFSKNEITTAEELAVDIGDACVSVGQFDPSTQSYITHIKGTPLFNFAVRPGHPYRIQVSEDSSWP